MFEKNQRKHSSQGQQVSVSLDLCLFSPNMLFAEAVTYDFDALVVVLLA